MELIELIKKLQNEKERDKIHPTHVMFRELLAAVNKEVRNELNSLYRDGKIDLVETKDKEKAVKIKE